jgi:hypothetical protein
MSEKAQRAQNVLTTLDTLLPDLQSIYKDIHSHPELSMQANRTAGIAAERLRAAASQPLPRRRETRPRNAGLREKRVTVVSKVPSIARDGGRCQR